MTPDDVRLRLLQVLHTERPMVINQCSTCNGSGVVHNRKFIKQADVARAVGVSRAQIGNFCIGKSDLSFPVGLRLIEYLDALE